MLWLPWEVVQLVKRGAGHRGQSCVGGLVCFSSWVEVAHGACVGEWKM
jgi:hypothetical protein